MKKSKIKKNNQKQQRGFIFPSWIVWSVTAVWGYIVLKSYYSVFKPNLSNLGIMLSFDQYLGIFNVTNLMIFKHLFNILLAAVFLFSAFSIGRILLKRSGIKWFNSLEEIVFSVGFGLGIIAYLIFIMGILKMLYTLPIIVMIVLFSIAGVLDLKRNPVKMILIEDRLSFIDIFAFILLSIAILLNLAGALSPEIFYDSLVYHLAVPNYYKLHNEILNMPYVFYSNLPLVHGMLFTAGIMIKNEFVAKLINYSAGVLTCAVLFSIAIRYFNYKIGLWACLVYYTIMHVMTSSWSCGTEMMLTFFGILSLYSIMNYTSEEKRWLIVSAIFAGLSMSVKYTGLFVAVGVLVTYIFLEKNLSLKTIKNIFIWGLISSVIVMPWLVKNYIYKNNPVYPFMSDIFPKEPYSDYEKFKEFTIETRQFEKLGIGNWLKHPWLVTMGKVPNSEHFTPLFLFLLPLIIILGKPSNALKYVIIYFLLVWITWSFSSTMIRFMMPAFPAAGLIIAYYLKTGLYKSLKQILLWVVLFTCFFSIYMSGWIYYIQGGWNVVTGRQSKEDFLATTHSSYPYGYYAGVEFINKNLPKDSKILFIGDGRSFYIERVPVVSSAQDMTPLVEYAKASKNADELYLKMKRKGITHIFFNLGEARRLGGNYKMFQWDKKSLSVYNKFWEKYVRQVFSKDEMMQGQFVNRIAVYEILSEKDALIPHNPPFNLMKEVVVKNIPIKE
ncbi:MAG: glycosyltransferase family 39 protein [Elusimicrobia bacterium]|nr:glycosyltransferase family 39 protein [Elusimicrobiota bacterium]